MVDLPSIQAVALLSVVPTSLGYINVVWAVSYGYSLSIAAIAMKVLQSIRNSTPPSSSSSSSSRAILVAKYHALVLFFFGVRLFTFLLYRRLFVPSFQKKDADHNKKQKSVGDRLKLTPMIWCCAILYASMCAPLFITSKSLAGVVVPADDETTTTTGQFTLTCVAIAFLGFLLAALADTTKSLHKAQYGEHALITSGVFHYLRHPNYTGEALGWTANLAAGLASIVESSSSSSVKEYTFLLLASVVGWLGIVAVLGMATDSLERKQAEKYGGRKEYVEWKRSSWIGLTFGGGKIKPKS